ncbi:GGDEF domain-containing protein [Azohydromonas aeria]|uniref:GGDEF domain-containing protein n=1 Tax=Azohydromonas aeria TaxID=2590212 RepID=UPI0012FA669E|nr:GGDEF domain-containing protein [Azohydromonas aeria]
MSGSLVISGVALLAVLALAAWARAASRRTGRLLHALAEQVRRVEQGDLPQRVVPAQAAPGLREIDEALQRAAHARFDAHALLQQRLALQTAALAQAQVRIEALETRDSLTGLPNRRSAEERLQAEILRHRRTGATFSLILASIDRFRHLHDTLGPAEGDAVVQAVAARLANACRCTDHVSRHDGDEFMVLLPDTLPAGAAVVARKLLLATSATPCRAAGTVTLSLGVLVNVEQVDAAQALDAVRRSLHQAQRRTPVAMPGHDHPLAGLLPA